MVSTWVWGCIINLCGSVVINVGTNLVKYHHTLMSRQAQRAYIQQMEMQHMYVERDRTRQTPTPSPPRESHLQMNGGHSTLPPNGQSHLHSSSIIDSPQLTHTGSSDLHSNNSTPVFSAQQQLLSPPSPRSPSSFHSNTAPLDGSPSSASPTQTQHFNSYHRSSLSHRSSFSQQQPASDRSVYWYAGFSLFALGNIANFISFMFTAQSLLAGLGSIQFISNVICSSLLHDHRVTARILLATCCIVTGNLFIVFFASKDSAPLNVADLWGLYVDNEAYQIYCVIMIITVLVLYVYYKETKKVLRQAVPAGQRLSLYHYRLLPFSYVAISAIIGSQSVLLAKSLSELIRTSIARSNQFLFPFTYFICNLLGAVHHLLALQNERSPAKV